MKGLPAETDFVVIGAGVAGLRAAIELASAGRVLVLAKGAGDSSHVQAAAGSTATPLSDEDEITLHLQDTLDAGDGLCRPDAVKTLLDEGSDRIEELIAWSSQLDRNGASFVFVPESPHARSRVLHTLGDSTRSAILRTLQAKARPLKNISQLEFEFSTELEVESGRVIGVSLIGNQGLPEEVACSAVLLATGGLGQIYRHTTNPDPATADGVAIAFRAGAEVSDMEFVQFHPTALYLKKAPPFLLSTAFLEEGAYLRNIELDRFMGKYHPMGELAPGNVVARAIIHEMEVSHTRDPFVYLDLTHLKAAQVHKHFERTYTACMKLNIDITEDLIPVRPAAHFAVGGVRTDLDGRTSLAGLYAAGEVAATGAHGANRLPGNALLEALVYGERAGKAMRSEVKQAKSKTGGQKKAVSQNGPVDPGIEDVILQIQDLMWKDVGIVRTRRDMQNAISRLDEMTPRLAHPKIRRTWEAAHLHQAGLLVARSALAREESRGAHYRTDCPGRDEKRFLKHSVVKGETVRFV
ncbi:MAG TPA: FAD-binding protein [Candidatus Aquilonibacter sp.]|nr:FAD-binding protein [Candidatus Aquilonibacter sp.]